MSTTSPKKKHRKTKFLASAIVKIGLWLLVEFVVSPIFLFVGLEILMVLISITPSFLNFLDIVWILLGLVWFLLSFSLPFIIFFPNKFAKFSKKRYAKHKAKVQTKKRFKNRKNKRGKK